LPNLSAPLPCLRPTPLTTSLLIGSGLLSLALGCRSDEVSHFRVPKEASFSESGPRPAMPPMPMGERTGDAANGPGAAPGMPPPSAAKGSLKWSLPKGWSEQPGGGTMRFATFKAPFAGKLEATVVVLPGQAGGELANVNRWRGQIGLPGFDEAGLTQARKVLKTKAGALNVYDFTSEGQAKSRMVAGYISTPDGNTWFLKMTGDADPVAKAKPDFMTILGSVRLD
jgi:hypothetical protein